MPERPVILVSAHGEGARLDPQSFLGPRFAAYRTAVSRCGARYVPAEKTNIISLDRLAALKAALEEEGFDLAVASELRSSILEQAQMLAERSAEAAATIERVQAVLEERGLALYPYQQDGVRWLAPRRGALLADEMGLGKTIQVLLALPENAHALVVAPAAVASAWLRECIRWRPDLRAGLTTGKASFRWPRRAELLVTTYGSLPLPDQEILMPPDGCYLVADEAHALKGKPARLKDDGTWGKGTKRVAAWNGLRDAVRAAQGRVWLLSGTPLVNRPPELWRVLEAAKLAQDAFGSWPRFMAMFHGHKGRWGTEWGQPSSDVPLALQTVMLRRDRQAVLPDLPRKRRQIREVSIDDAEALALADELQEALAAAGLSIDVLADMRGLARRERKIIFERLSKVRAALATAKIPALLTAVEEYEAEEIPLVVFSAHLAPLHALAARPGWKLIVGDVSPEERGRTVDDFQAGRLRGVGCTFRAGGVGITLTHSHHCLCVDMPWTPADLAQAEDRLCRIGQEADSVHDLILACSHPVDLRVAELIAAKARLIEATVEAASVEHVTLDERLTQDAEALAEMAAGTSDLAEQVERERAERERQKLLVKQNRAARALGDFEVGGGGIGEHNGFRPPQTEEEARAARVLVLVTDADPDYAREENGVGFNRLDGDIGHSLAESLVRYGRLSEKQWAVALRLGRRYAGQLARLDPSART